LEKRLGLSGAGGEDEPCCSSTSTAVVCNLGKPFYQHTDYEKAQEAIDSMQTKDLGGVALYVYYYSVTPSITPDA